jgi:hypothetical protein
VAARRARLPTLDRRGWLALDGIHTSGKPVLRLTREAGLLAPAAAGAQARGACMTARSP